MAKKTESAGKKKTTTEKKVHSKPKAKETKTHEVHKDTKSKPKGDVTVYSVAGSSKGNIQLPEVFFSEARPDLVQRAVVVEQSQYRQPYGTDPRAGLKNTAQYYARRRGYYRLTVNRGMSRLPRVKLPKGGLGQVRLVPQSRGGRRSHPPKAEKKFDMRMNRKEWLLALKSAIASTKNPDFVKGEGRNHVIDNVTLPLIVEGGFEDISKTKEVLDLFSKLKLEGDLQRAEQKSVRAGKGKTRGRKYKKKKSVLVVVSKDSSVEKASRNIPGVDAINVDELNVELLAPGGFMGRLTVWTEPALERLDEILKNEKI